MHKGKNRVKTAWQPPALKREACRLLYISFGIICVYLTAAALYAGGAPGDPLRRDTAFTMLQSAYIASVIATGGALVLDYDIRISGRR